MDGDEDKSIELQEFLKYIQDKGAHRYFVRVIDDLGEKLGLNQFSP